MFSHLFWWNWISGWCSVAAWSQSETNVTYSYTLQDHLGGTALVTDLSGAVTEVYDYYPYGDELIADQLGSTETIHTFTDKEFSEDLGLYYFEARWFNPSIGRFASSDPAQLDNRVFSLLNDPQSFNFYAYSRNNPVNLVDPSGEFAFIPFLLVAASVAFTAWDAYDIGTQIANEDYTGAAIGATLSVVNPLPNVVVKNPIVKNLIVDTATKVDNAVGNILSEFTQKELKWSQGPGGNSQESLYQHFKNHGDEIGAQSVQDYYNAANDLIQNPNAKIIDGPRGDTTIYFDSDTNMRAIVNNSNGEIKTFHEVTSEAKIQEYNSN